MTEAFDFGTLDGTDAIDGTPYMLGDEFESSVTGSVTGVRWRAPDSGSGLGAPCIAKLYRVSDTSEVATSDGAGFTPSAGVSNDVAFVTPFAITAGVRYVAAVLTRRYTYRTTGFPYTSSPAEVMTAQQGRLRTTTAGNPVFPNTTTTLCFHIGPLFEPDASTVDGTLQAAAGAAVLSGAGSRINPGDFAIASAAGVLASAGELIDPAVLGASLSGFTMSAAATVIVDGTVQLSSAAAVLALSEGLLTNATFHVGTPKTKWSTGCARTTWAAGRPRVGG